MAPQHVEVMETLVNLKRKLRRDKEASFAQPITGATNRYNKLQKGANYIHAGALPYPHGPEGYKQTIEHAGYTRSILARNPPRFNEYGDELADEDSDPEADADAQEENPYTDVHIEELLAPLRHPSELATHPTLSVPYRDPTLPDMVKTLEETIRQERDNLWRAKKLQMKLIGDEEWMPLGRIETPGDWDLFEPKPQRAESSRKRKRDEEAPAQNGVNGHVQATAASSSTNSTHGNVAADDANEVTGADAEAHLSKQLSAADDVDMQDAGAQGAAATDANTTDPRPDEGKPPTANGDPDATNGADNPAQTGSDAGTPPPPSRRITRALAAETTTLDGASQHSRSPSLSSIPSDLLNPDPIYLLPPSLNTEHRLPALLASLGMTIEELLETRRLLMMYIQKQEETIRGYEAMLQKLYKAKRMRGQVWDWCKAEGHVGEMSDGEDWVDAAAWGEREEDLKKGKDEDETGEAAAEEEHAQQQTRGRAKGKRRRGRERE